MSIRAMQKVLGQYEAHLRALRSCKEGPFWGSGMGDELKEDHIYTCHIHQHTRDPCFDLGQTD